MVSTVGATGQQEQMCFSPIFLWLEKRGTFKRDVSFLLLLWMVWTYSLPKTTHFDLFFKLMDFAGNALYFGPNSISSVPANAAMFSLIMISA